MAEQLFTRIHQPIVLEKKIGSGGEGEIWQVDKLDVLAKIFHQYEPTRLEKLQAMMHLPPHDPMAHRQHVSIPWPQELLFDAQGNFKGYLMARVSGSLTLNNVYNPKLRNSKAPGFNWYYLHVAALNTASIVDALHARGYIIGDMKPDNFLVNDKALVSIIDTDSFQVKRSHQTFFCPVASDGFTAPELIGRDMQHVTRTVYHDAFGLAVLIYMLLTGEHPFSGQWRQDVEPMERDAAIAGGIWPYGLQNLLRPSPLSLSLEQLPGRIREAFFQTFNDGHKTPEKRVLAKEWCHILAHDLDALKTCSKNTNHYSYAFNGTCTWCDRAAKLGYEAFPPTETEAPLSFFQAFDAAVKSHDVRQMIALWDHYDQIGHHPDYGAFEKQITLLRADLLELDSFKTLCMRPGVSAEEILTKWQNNPKLHGLSAQPGETIEGKPVVDFLNSLTLQAADQERLKAAIQVCDQHFDQRTATPEDEQQLLDIFDELKQKNLPFLKQEAFVARHKLARKRLKLWQQFRGLWRGDAQALYEGWLTHNDCLAGFALPAEIEEKLKFFQSQHKVFKIFEKKIQADADASELLSVWQTYPRFKTTFFADCYLVAGASILTHVARADKKMSLLQKFQEADRKNQLHHVVDLWDPELCDQDSHFLPYKKKILSLGQNRYQWARLRAAALENEKDYVVANWSESFSPLAYQEQISDKVQACFQSVFFDKALISHPGTERVFEHRDYWEIFFPWPLCNEKDSAANHLTHLIFTAHTQDFPACPEAAESPHLYQVVQKPSAAAKHVTVYFPKAASKQFFSVFPAMSVCQRIMAIGVPRQFQAPQHVAELRYGFFTKGKKEGYSLYLQMFCSEKLVIPPFAIGMSAKRPLTTFDSEAEVLTEMQAIACEKGETLLKLKFSDEGADGLPPFLGIFIHDRSFYDKVRVTHLTTNDAT